MQGNLATSRGFGPSHDQHAGIEVDIVPVQAQGLAETQTADCQQAYEGLIGHRPPRRAQLPSSFQKSGQLSFGEEVRRQPGAVRPEEICRGDLRREVDRLQVAGEIAYDT
jgi:hypothetical protein